MAHAEKPYQLVPADGPPPSSNGADAYATAAVRVASRGDRAYERRT
jgi:hypothetical protein